MGLTPVCAIDPAAVCAHFDIRLIPLSEIAPDSPFLRGESSTFSAVTVPRGHQRAIVHNDVHHIHRQRSNISHELAHCFLGHPCTPPLMEDGQRSRHSGYEAEANFLAGTLLLPNEACLHILQNALSSQAKIIYGISSAMLTYRMRMSGANTIFERRMWKDRRRAVGA